jgi:hypothetical protein
MGQNLFEHGEENRRNRRGMGIDPFKKLLSRFRLTNRLMAGQPRHVDLYDPLQGKFIEKFLDESIKGYPSAGGSIAIDGPEVSDIQHKTAGGQRCDEPKKMRNRDCAGGKICERRHLQEKQRRGPIRSTTLPIHHLLNCRNICCHHLGAQLRK